MRLLSTRIADYGPFKGVHEFTIADRGLTLILGKNLDEPRMNSNGSGKSSLLGAIDWCQHGVVPSGDHVDSVIYEFGNGTQVTNYYDDDGVPLIIQRSKQRGKSMKAQFWRGGSEVTTLDVRELQRIIESNLGLDREVFHATVLYGQQDQFNFASANDPKRMEILTKILQLGDIDAMAATVKEMGKRFETEESRFLMQEARLRGVLEAPAIDFGQQSTAWENTRAESLRSATVQLNDYLENIQKAKVVVATEPRVRAMTSVFDPMGATVYDWADFGRKIDKAKVLEDQWRSKLAVTTANGKALRSRRDEFDSLQEGDCSECGQPITKEHVQKEIGKLDQLLEVSRTEYAEQAEQLRIASYLRQSAEQNKREAQQAHMEAEKDLAHRNAEARTQLAQIEETKEYLKKAEAHVEYLRGEMATTHQKVNPWTAKMGEALVETARIEAELQTVLDQLVVIRVAKSYTDFWKKAFGPAGLKNYILDSRLQEMNDCANYWVKLITGGTFWIRIETQTMGRSTKKLSNKINVKVFRYNKDGTVSERNFRTWSGGEKMRIAWAIDWGLSRLIAARAHKRWDLLVLDEVFKYVDAKGGEAVIEMLQHLRKEKSSIFVIEHGDEFCSQFENRVVVQRQNGISRIVNEEGDRSGDKEETPEEASQKTASSPGPRKKKSKGKVRRKRIPRRQSVS